MGTETGNVRNVTFFGVENVIGVLDNKEPPEAKTEPFADQAFYLDFEGAIDVTYEGPIMVQGIDVPAFEAPLYLRGQEEVVVGLLLDSLKDIITDFDIVFFTEESSTGSSYSTIYIGGDSSAFSEYGPFIGLSEKIDKGNLDHSDIAFVFSDNIESSPQTAADYGSELASYVAHEAGHLMGFGDTDHHAATDDEVSLTLTDGSTVNLSLYEDAKGGLKENVGFDKETFAAYADSVTLCKLLLLQEELP